MPVSQKKHEMPTQSPEIRAKNFKEVALGYSEERLSQRRRDALIVKTDRVSAVVP